MTVSLRRRLVQLDLSPLCTIGLPGQHHPASFMKYPG